MSKTPQNPTSPPESHYPRDPAARERDPNFWTASHGRAVDPDVLPRVLSRAAALREQAVLVFDLDSTLLDNKPRQARIVREAGQALGEPRLLGCQPEHFTDWSVDKPLRRLGLRDEEIPDLVPKVRRFGNSAFSPAITASTTLRLPGRWRLCAMSLRRAARLPTAPDGTKACDKAPWPVLHAKVSRCPTAIASIC